MTLPPSLRWTGTHLELLDQRQLPGAVVFMQLKTWDEVATAISTMAVRGAPAIGIAAAWGVVLAAQAGDDLSSAIRGLSASRPTAVNLGWALKRMESVLASTGSVNCESLAVVAAELQRQDCLLTQRLVDHGVSLLSQGVGSCTIAIPARSLPQVLVRHSV